MKKLTLLCCFIALSSICLAQNQTKKWYFGSYAGMDFMSGTPVPMTGGQANIADNTATISDAAGNLLFYSDGVTVWNSLHNVMSNGTGLLGSQTGGQPATIVPYPGNPNLYYLFTVDAFAFSNGIRYSIIDMSQQSGLGAVTTIKNVLIYAPATEKVIAVKHCNRRDFWLITHAWQNNQFKVYLIDNNGLNTVPVVSSVGTTHIGGTLGYYNACGQITVSKDGSRIGLTLHSDGTAEFLDFDNTSGAVSNPVSISGFPNAWGIEFSDNGNVAYITRWQGTALWQVNLLAGNAAAIQASTYLVGSPSSPHPNYKSGYIKRGPDGKIYVTKYSSPFLGVIDNPDVLGSGCNFVDNGFSLGGPTSQAGLDNSVWQGLTLPVIQYSGTCQYQFNISDTTDLLSANWNFGDPSTGPLNTASTYSAVHTFSSAGTYAVQLIINYTCFSDTLTQLVSTSGGAPNGQFIATNFACDSTIVFTNNTTNGVSYHWNFGDGDTSVATNPTHTFPGAGTFTVTLISDNTCASDTTISTVVIPSVPAASISGVDTICQGQSVTLTATGGTSIQWSGGSTATTYTISDSPQNTTAYYATVSNGTCASEPDTFMVVVRPLPLVTISGLNNICAGQNITLTASGAVNYQWSGGSSATTSAINVAPLSTTTYYVTTSDGLCTSVPDTFVVTILPTPIVTIVGPTTICYGQTVTLAANGATSYQWSGGSNATTSTITVSPITNTTYYASPGASTCPGIPDTLTIVVTPTPIVNASGNTTICAGQSTTLTATGGTSYQWSGGSTDTTASITVSPIATTTYFVTTSNGPCTSGFDTITVVVTPSPTVTIIAPTMICPGTGVTLTAVGNAVTYVWAGGASGTGTTITDTPTSPTTYYLVGYNSQGCSDTDAVTIGLYDVMNAAILGDDSICVGESTSLSCAGNGTFAWGPSTGLNTTTGPSVIASPTTTITYSVTFTDANGCVTNDAVSVQVDACVGIVESQSTTPEIHLLPNPAGQSTTLLFTEEGPAQITIFNSVGQEVLTMQVIFQAQSGIEINLSSLSDGMYVVQVTGDTEVVTTPLLINK